MFRFHRRDLPCYNPRMATPQEYFDFIRGQLDIEGVSWRKMMGEYILYFHGRIAGGIYDSRLLIKDVPSAREAIPGFTLEEPYPGARPMILVDDVDSPDFLAELLRKIFDDLPEPKKKPATMRQRQ